MLDNYIATSEFSVYYTLLSFIFGKKIHCPSLFSAIPNSVVFGPIFTISIHDNQSWCITNSSICLDIRKFIVAKVQHGVQVGPGYIFYCWTENIYKFISFSIYFLNIVTTSKQICVEWQLAVLLFVLARCGSSITIWKMAKLGEFPFG